MREKIAHGLSSAPVRPPGWIRKASAVVGCVALICLGLSPSAHAAVVTTSISTTNGNWTVTADGLVNATPYSLTEKYTGFNYLIGLTDTGFSTGNFLPGGNPATFDGFWTANYNFFIPAGATAVTLNYLGMFSDDRAVLELNGHIINSTAYVNSPGSQYMIFTDGGPLTQWTFNGPNGSVGGTISSWFNVGGLNTLTAIVNNSGNGGQGGDLNLGTGDESTFGLLGALNYTVVPEPAPLALLGQGGLVILSGIALRRTATRS
jgi:hypothetical protein